MKIAVTGASGFIGKKLCFTLCNSGFQVNAILRNKSLKIFSENIAEFEIQSFEMKKKWLKAFQDVDCLVHCASKIPARNEKDYDNLNAFRKINVENTITVAQYAFNAGVKRIVFISSIKVNGEKTSNGITFSPDSATNPQNAYSLSKLEAEIKLLEFAKRSGVEVVIIRPPLVYGPDVGGNFLSVLKLLSYNLPLPFGVVNNRRSYVYINNLIDFIKTCIIHPKSANQRFMVSDGEDLSTTQLMAKLIVALGCRTKLIKVPPITMNFALKILQRDELFQRLFKDLQVDISKNRELLGWKPPFTVDTGLQDTVRWFKSKQ